jgi:prenyltransferase beta subunit
MWHVLRQGANRLSRDAQRRIREYAASQTDESGFFMNRHQQPDIYYTAFGLTVAQALGMKIDRKKIGQSLGNCRPDTSDLVHFASYIRSLLALAWMDTPGWLSWIRYRALCFRTTLPAFPTVPHDDPQSPYTRFVLLSLREDLLCGRSGWKAIPEALEDYRTPGGGYANVRRASCASTNATAAALSVRGQLRGYRPDGDVTFLRDMQDDSGGFAATQRTPAPDLLSTATALFTLYNYGLSPRTDPGDFVEAHWMDSGGFAATLPDDDSDMEYTFYGLLALGTCGIKHI